MEEQQLAAKIRLAAAYNERQDTNINLCLCAAQAALDSGEYADADRLFKRGLAWSEERYGGQSAAVGLVIMSIIELYEKDGNNRSTDLLERRLRHICRRFFFRAIANRMNGGQ